MKVVIVGAGVGGLSTAHALLRLPFITSIKILDVNAKDHNLIDNTYTGLWSPSLKVIRRYGIDIEKNLCFVGNSGYRSVDGAWLARPKTPPVLGFIKMELLVSALLSSLSSSVSIINENVKAIVRDNNSIMVVSDNNKYQADLVIAADGKNSTVRNLLHNDSTLKYRGYEVYRGHSSSSFHFAHKQRISEDSFQTWGSGIRFATVPTNDGNAWFLAKSKQLVPTNDSIPKGTHSVISKDQFEDIKNIVNKYHRPITDLIANTDNGHEGVVLCDAYGSNSTKIKQSVIWNNSGISFLGDASYTLDPILAQGTGLAIEHSYLLAKAIQTHKNNLGLALKYYDDMKMERQYRLHHLSDLSQAIGNLHDKNMIRIRDKVMTTIYNNYPKLVGMAFDKIISLSSSDRYL